MRSAARRFGEDVPVQFVDANGMINGRFNIAFFRM
jgi:hypothetical protein